jgi:hypothetical protein
MERWQRATDYGILPATAQVLDYRDGREYYLLAPGGGDPLSWPVMSRPKGGSSRYEGTYRHWLEHQRESDTGGPPST